MIKVNIVKEWLKKLLTDEVVNSDFNKDDIIISISEESPSQINLDINALKPNGTMKLDFSLDGRTGLASVIVKDIDRFEKNDANIFKFAKEAEIDMNWYRQVKSILSTEVIKIKDEILTKLLTEFHVHEINDELIDQLIDAYKLSSEIAKELKEEIKKELEKVKVAEYKLTDSQISLINDLLQTIELEAVDESVYNNFKADLIKNYDDIMSLRDKVIKIYQLWASRMKLKKEEMPKRIPAVDAVNALTFLPEAKLLLQSVKEKLSDELKKLSDREIAMMLVRYLKERYGI